MNPRVPIEFARCELGLSQSPTPAWVLDAASLTFRWANDAALEFWGADTREALFARDIITSAPKPVVERIRGQIARCREGERVSEEWIMYPNGQRRTILLDVRAVQLDAGKLGMLLQAQPLAGVASEAVERNVAMHRHATVILGLASHTGALLAQNPAATATFGEREGWPAWFEDPAEAERILEATLADEVQRNLLPVRTLGGERRWHLVVTQPMRDPVSADIGVLVEHLDVSAQVEAEALAETTQATLEIVERQRREILQLSAPLLEVGDATLAVPLIGRLDRERHELLMAKLLEHVSTRGVRRVLLDLTGIAEVDGDAGQRLVQLIAALGLLGARATLTGVRPALAQELASTGAALEGVTFHRSLARGLAQSGGLGGRGA